MPTTQLKRSIEEVAKYFDMFSAMGDHMCSTDIVPSVLTLATWTGGGSQRVRGNLRAIVRDLGMLAITFGGGTLRRYELHHCRLLVYGVNLFCKPSTHNRPLLV